MHPFRRNLLFLSFLILACSPLSAQSLLDGYFKRVAEQQAEQPHWITPVFTVTPRLEQEIRYDVFWQGHANGTTTENYGGSKGLELIPAKNVEVILGIPPYLVHNEPAVSNGWGDETFLVKYRFLSRNEENGNYILTAFLGASIPTGQYKNGAPHAVITPTLAFGKGWGNFDVVTTAGIQLPTSESQKLGQPVVWNVTGQYRVMRKIWPELEMNSTFYHNGPNGGKQQVFVTPGVMFGKFPIWHRLGATVGVGVQIATTHFHTYNHGWILTMRLPF
jgi:hypothetical protein